MPDKFVRARRSAPRAPTTRNCTVRQIRRRSLLNLSCPSLSARRSACALASRSLERVPVISNHFFRESWPGLSRPSTPCLLSRCKTDVDARHKRGHDGWRGDPTSSGGGLTLAICFLALAVCCFANIAPHRQRYIPPISPYFASAQPVRSEAADWRHPHPSLPRKRGKEGWGAAPLK